MKPCGKKQRHTSKIFTKVSAISASDFQAYPNPAGTPSCVCGIFLLLHDCRHATRKRAAPFGTFLCKIPDLFCNFSFSGLFLVDFIANSYIMR